MDRSKRGEAAVCAQAAQLRGARGPGRHVQVQSARVHARHRHMVSLNTLPAKCNNIRRQQSASTVKICKRRSHGNGNVSCSVLRLREKCQSQFTQDAEGDKRARKLIYLYPNPKTLLVLCVEMFIDEEVPTLEAQLAYQCPV